MADKVRINSLIVMDFETGGAKPDTGKAPSNKYPVTEFACSVLEGVSLDSTLRYDNKIKPYDDDLIYTDEAARITGITKAMTEEHGIDLKDFFDDFKYICDKAMEGVVNYKKPVIVGHNIGFDADFLIDIARRAEFDLSRYLDGYKDSQGNFHLTLYDTMDMAQLAWGDDPGMKFNLESCCFRANVDISDAHSAKNDVAATVDLYRYLVRQLRGKSQIEEQEASEEARTKFQF